MPRSNSQNWSVGNPVTAARLQDINLDLDELFANGDDRGRVQLAASETALAVDVAAFVYRVGSSFGLFAGTTDLMMADNATNYIEINSGGTVSVNQVGFDTQKARLATVVTSGGVITSINIMRADIIGGDLGGGAGGFEEITSITRDGRGQITEIVADGFTYTLTYNKDGTLASIDDSSTLVEINRDRGGRIISTTTS